MQTNSKDHRVLSQSFAANRSDPPDKEEEVLSDVSIVEAPKTSRPNLPEDLPVAIRSKRATDDSVTVPPYPVPPPVFSRSLQLVARSKRATDDEYSQAIHRGQQLARITSAIYLHQAIAMNQLQSEVLISELLRIGSVKASDISSIDPTTINKIVGDVDQLATSLTSDKEIQRIEERMKLYASMLKKTEMFMKDQQVTGKEEFIKEVKGLKAKNVDMTDINTFVVYVYSVLENLEKLKDPSQSTIEAGQGFLQLEVNLKLVKHVDAKALESDQLRNGPEIFKPLFLVLQSLEDYKHSSATNVDPADKKPIGDIQSNMKALNEVVSKVDQSKAMIDNMCRMFLTSQHPNGNVNLQYTHGFTDGYLDLLTVFKDLEDDWVKTAVREQSAQLAKGLNYLKDLYEKSKSVAQHLHMEESDFKLMSSRCDSLAYLADLATKIDPLSSQLESIAIDATPNQLRPSNHDQFNTLLGNIQILSKNLKAVDDVAQLANELRDGKGIEKLRSITEESKKNLDEAWNKIKSDPEVLIIYGMIDKRKKSLEILKKRNTLDILGEVDKNFDQVGTYISGLSNYKNHLQKLQKLAGTKFIKEVVGGIEKFRGVNSPGSIAKTVNLVDDIKSKVAELKKTVDEMKVDTAPESKALEAPDLSEVSKVIGSAVQGINSMKKLAAFPQDRHQKLKDGSELVNKQIGSVHVDPEDLKNLQLLISLPSQLDTVSNGISSMKSSTTVSLEDTITAQTAVFESAASVQGLQYDFMKMVNSVEELLVDLPAGPESDSIKEIIPILKELESIGLDFSRHNAAFQNSKSKLDELDIFFADYVSNLSKKPPAKTSMTGLSSTQSSQGAQDSDITSSKGNIITDNPVWSAVIGAIIVGGVSGVVVWAIVYCRKNKKNKEKKVVEEIKPHIDVPLIQPPIIVENPKERSLQRTQSLEILPVVNVVTAELLRTFVNGLYDDVIHDNLGRRFKAETFPEMLCAFLKTKFLAYSRPKTETWSESLREWSDYFLGEIPLSKHNRISVKNTGNHFKKGTELRLHGNLLTFKDGTEVALMQAPVNPRFFKLKKSNVEQWYYKAMEMQTKVIICLTRQFEMWSGGQQCAEYYPQKEGESVTFDRLKIFCESLTEKHEGDLQIRKLRVEFEGHPPFVIEKHFVYTGWPKSYCPGKDTVVIELLDELAKAWDEHNKPVIIHSSDSTGRAACLVLIKLFREDFQSGVLPFEPVFQKLRLWRANGVENASQYTFCFIIFYRLLLKDLPPEAQIDANDSHNCINEAITSILQVFDKTNKENATKTDVTADQLRSVADDVYYEQQKFKKNAKRGQQKRSAK
ncbi:unnamed protein product [Caenorhabditis brenneri]